MSVERRLHPRNEVKGKVRLTLSIEAVNMPVEHYEAYIVDISESGVGVTLSREIETGLVVTFVEKEMDWPYPDKGLIMWTAQSSGVVRAGIRFLSS